LLFTEKLGVRHRLRESLEAYQTAKDAVARHIRMRGKR
jgi:hypothetical protein